MQGNPAIAVFSVYYPDAALFTHPVGRDVSVVVEPAVEPPVAATASGLDHVYLAFSDRSTGDAFVYGGVVPSLLSPFHANTARSVLLCAAMQRARVCMGRGVTRWRSLSPSSAAASSP